MYKKEKCTFSHCPHNAEYIHRIVDLYRLQYPVQRDERAGSADTSTAVHANRSLLGAHAFPERSHKSHQRLRRIRHTEIGPRDEMEVPDDALLVAATYHELGDGPVRVVTVVQDLDLNVAVVHRHGVVRPVLVAFLAPLLEASRQHYDGSRVGLPAHAPEVVARRVERTLRYDELARRVVAL